MTTMQEDSSAVPSAKVLRNKGIPVQVHKVQKTTDADGLPTWTREFEPDGDSPILEQVYVRMGAGTLADLEEQWESISGWNEALSVKPFRTLVETLAIIWEVPRDQAAKMLCDDRTDAYSTAVGGAFAMANGGSTDAVVRVLEVGAKTSKTKSEYMTEATMEELNETEKALDKAVAEAGRLRAEAAAPSEAPTDDASSSETKSLPDGPSGDHQVLDLGTPSPASGSLSPEQPTTKEEPGAPGDDGSPTGSDLVEASSTSGT